MSNNKNDDFNLWEKVKKTVTPLLRHQQRKNEKPDFGSFKDALQEQSGSLSSENKIDHVKLSAKKIEKSNPSIGSGLDGRTQKRLRQGKMAIDATLDFHGLTQEQAYDALISFVDRSRQNKKRLVLVITGKGRFSKSGESILKKNLPTWVSTNPLNEWVLECVPAHKKHGGSGAFYLLLRRNRPV